MTARPMLRVEEPSGPVTAVAVVLHGGREHSVAATRPHNLAVLRMLPFATALQRAAGGRGLAVARLRHLVRGWNGELKSPVADAQWALDTLAARYPGAPVALVGHSMGGRTALYVAGHESVRAVIGLAPWVVDEDPVGQLAGRRVLIVHGTHDRVTSGAASARYADRAREVATSVSHVRVDAERHAMIRRARVWHDLATGFALGVLYDADPTPASHRDTTSVLARALAGQASLVV